MTNKTKGNLFVVAQFALLAALILIPSSQGTITSTYVGGVLFIAPGLILLYVSVKNLGRSLTANPVPKEDAQLVETGVYKFVRHPIYSGLLLAALGTVVQSMDISKAVIWATLFIVLNFKATWEETLLVKKYSTYTDYMKRTGRFVPRLK
jgi:protein-S-isoprenylcysteine O-methyltransferase Ste14